MRTVEATSLIAWCLITALGSLWGVEALAVEDLPPDSPLSTARFYGPLASRRSPLTATLQRPVSVQWHNLPLADALDRLSKQFTLPLWLDRRIDPTQPLHFTGRPITLQALLHQVALQTDLGIVLSRGVIYLGPQHAAEQLRTLWALMHQQVATLPVATQQTMLRPFPLDIPRGTPASEAISQLTQRMGVRLKDQDQIPYDLWPERHLPRMPVAEQLSLLLLEFDLCWKVTSDGRSLQVQPIQPPVVVARRHPRVVEEMLSDPRFHELGPFQVGPRRENGVTVTARVEQHALLAGRTDWGEEFRQASNQGARPANSPAVPPSQQVYSLRLEQQPAQAVLESLAQQLRVRLSIRGPSSVVKKRLQRRISLEVSQASLEELLQAVGQAVQLQMTLREREIEVAPIDESIWQSGSSQQSTRNGGLTGEPASR